MTRRITLLTGSSRRNLFIDVFIFKNKLSSPPVSPSYSNVGQPKTGVRFYCECKTYLCIPSEYMFKKKHFKHRRFSSRRDGKNAGEIPSMQQEGARRSLRVSLGATGVLTPPPSTRTPAITWVPHIEIRRTKINSRVQA